MTSSIESTIWLTMINNNQLLERIDPNNINPIIFGAFAGAFINMLIGLKRSRTIERWIYNLNRNPISTFMLDFFPGTVIGMIGMPILVNLVQ